MKINTLVSALALCIGAANAQNTLRGLTEYTFIVEPPEKNVVSPAVATATGTSGGSGTSDAGTGGGDFVNDVVDRQMAPAGPACSVHPVCSDLGLTGSCCPTEDNEYLDCCLPSCKLHAACDSLGLEGDCCPSGDGVELDCCNYDEAMERNAGAKCSSHSKCSAIPLADMCCPTRDGVFLDCCDKEVPFP
ncbi:glycoside hydrolase family 16 protein [Seminavis robusta]|uniref:Glycoside hydrolase family 16 protein n=1 Tax=Seminavis robusta TaxID=568900 RepID=A0A9N8DRQ5_9STRA|nr:glycoside hydrolase family 16 protein [Seminavis robusta]|eukprot:Sro307_g113430.1 glycoside hydrolase family 16 protein (190) ;mRNA; f:66856-67425